MLVLHQMQISGNCYKVRLAARQLGIALVLKEYPLEAGLTRKPEFLAKNPNGRVPLLGLEDGRCLAESDAILFYLAEGSGLIPKDSWARAKMLEWMFFEQYEHEPAIAVARFLKTYSTKPELWESQREHLTKRGLKALAALEFGLDGREWLAGDGMTVADIALYAYTHCSGEGGFSLDAYPAIRAWLDRVAAEPGHVLITA